MQTFVQASNGDLIPVDSLAHTYAYNGDGTLATDTVTYGSKTFVQTYTYNGSGQLTNTSKWEVQ